MPCRHDVLAPLLASDNEAIVHMARRDLVDARPPPIRKLWGLPAARRVLARQQGDGRWKYSGGNRAVRSQADYDQLETYRQLNTLVAKFGLDRRHPAVEAAKDFLSSFQTEAGDYRGIYGNQYTPNYSAAITEVLINAGYANTPQVVGAMRWLLSIRQDDGGWAIPTRTLGLPLTVMQTETQVFAPDRTRPSSHLITGIVLRALVAHPRYRRSKPTQRAAALLKSRFFTRDAYPDHAAAAYWLVFSYPFWWTDLLSALDSVTRAGLGPEDPDVQRGLTWFYENQEPNGLWNTGRNRPKDPASDLWVALAVCRVLKRCLGIDALGASSSYR